MKYDAFISYSHSDCGIIAPAIQKAIENIGKPWYKLNRNLNVFRDETNLGANPHLWENIENALDNSDSFILLASPNTSKSDWITKEIEKWIEKNPSLDKLYIVKTDGEIIWDNTNNDFDWEKTNCLPKVLKSKFNKEPLYIDLSEYVNKNNRPIDYKSPGFTYKIVKIISGITGVEPREIESDEKKRRQKTILALISTFVILLTISTLLFIFFRQKEVNKRNAVANNLIAEGNKYRETDIDKALIRYADAYEINPTPELFTLISDFYYNKTLDTVAFDGIKKSYFLNKFSSTVFNKQRDEMDENNVFFEAVFPALNIYCSYKDGEIVFYDLRLKTKIKTLKISNCLNISSDKSTIMYETENNDLITYNVSDKKMDTIAISGKLRSNNQEVTSSYDDQKFIQAYLKNSSVVVFKQIEPKKLKIFVGDCKGKKWSEHILNNDADGTSIGMRFRLINCKIDSINKIIHYSSGIYYRNQYYKEEIINLNYPDIILYNPPVSYRDNYSYSIQSSFTNDYFITSLYNGQIEVHKDMGWNNEEQRNAPKAIDISKGLVDFVIYKDYLIAGYDTGKLNFYLLYGNDNDLKNDYLQYEEMPLLKSIYLPADQKVFQLILHNDILYIITDNGSLLKILLKLKINLDKNPDNLSKKVKLLFGK